MVRDYTNEPIPGVEDTTNIFRRVEQLARQERESLLSFEDKQELAKLRETWYAMGGRNAARIQLHYRRQRLALGVPAITY